MGHLLTPALKEIPRTRAECLLQWHTKNGHENIFFMDRKSLPSRGSITTRTTRFMLKRPLRRVLRLQGGHHPSYVMVGWGSVPLRGNTPSFLRERGETGARVYQDDMLQGVVKPLNISLFNGQAWVFQQDSAPAHKVKKTEE
jgi:hypothetical protein